MGRARALLAPQNRYTSADVPLAPASEFDSSMFSRARASLDVQAVQLDYVSVWDVETAAAMAMHTVFTSNGPPSDPDSLFNLNSEAAERKRVRRACCCAQWPPTTARARRPR